MTQRYRVTGRPNVPFDVLQDRAVGDEFDTDLDQSEERFLVDIGALEKLATDDAPKPEATAAVETPAAEAPAESQLPKPEKSPQPQQPAQPTKQRAEEPKSD